MNTLRKRTPIVILLVAMLILAACGGGDDDSGDSGDDTNGSSDNNTETVSATVDNLDQSIALDNSDTYAADTTFESFTINYPSTWTGFQDGFVVVVSNSADDANNYNFVLAGSNEMDSGSLLITGQTMRVLQFSGVPTGNATNPEELINSYGMALGAADATTVSAYEGLDFPAARADYPDGIPSYAPAGTTILAVEYPAGMVLYQVLTDGDFADYEAAVNEIVSNITLEAIPEEDA